MNQPEKESLVAEILTGAEVLSLEDQGWAVMGYRQSYLSTNPNDGTFLIVRFREDADRGEPKLTDTKNVVVVDRSKGVIDQPFSDPRLMWSGQWSEPPEDMTVVEVIRGLEFDPESFTPIQFGSDS